MAEPDPTARFAEVVGGPESSLRLDVALLLIAAHAQPGLDVAAWLGRLDALAAGCADPTSDSLHAHLFETVGFDGDRDDYYAPENSYLDRVIDRRRGIPITLAVVVMEVGRRLGLDIAGVGMPGHFLVRVRAEPGRFIDPFDRGAVHDRDGCRQLFDTLHRGRLAFDDSYLDPVTPTAIVGRVLANLRAIHLARRDRPSLLWVQRLRAMLPSADADEVRELAAALAANGRLDEAADILDQLASGSSGEATDGDRDLARALRSRLN